MSPIPCAQSLRVYADYRYVCYIIICVHRSDKKNQDGNKGFNLDKRGSKANSNQCSEAKCDCQRVRKDAKVWLSISMIKALNSKSTLYGSKLKCLDVEDSKQLQADGPWQF